METLTIPAAWSAGLITTAIPIHRPLDNNNASLHSRWKEGRSRGRSHKWKGDKKQGSSPSNNRSASLKEEVIMVVPIVSRRQGQQKTGEAVAIAEAMEMAADEEEDFKSV